MKKDSFEEYSLEQLIAMEDQLADSGEDTAYLREVQEEIKRRTGKTPLERAREEKYPHPAPQAEQHPDPMVSTGNEPPYRDTRKTPKRLSPKKLRALKAKREKHVLSLAKKETRKQRFNKLKADLRSLFADRAYDRVLYFREIVSLFKPFSVSEVSKALYQLVKEGFLGRDFRKSPYRQRFNFYWLQAHCDGSGWVQTTISGKLAAHWQAKELAYHVKVHDECVDRCIDLLRGAGFVCSRKIRIGKGDLDIVALHPVHNLNLVFEIKNRVSKDVMKSEVEKFARKAKKFYPGFRRLFVAPAFYNSARKVCDALDVVRITLHSQLQLGSFKDLFRGARIIHYSQRFSCALSDSSSFETLLWFKICFWRVLQILKPRLPGLRFNTKLMMWWQPLDVYASAWLGAESDFAKSFEVKVKVKAKDVADRILARKRLEPPVVYDSYVTPATVKKPVIQRSKKRMFNLNSVFEFVDFLLKGAEGSYDVPIDKSVANWDYLTKAIHDEFDFSGQKEYAQILNLLKPVLSDVVFNERIRRVQSGLGRI